MSSKASEWRNRRMINASQDYKNDEQEVMANFRKIGNTGIDFKTYSDIPVRVTEPYNNGIDQSTKPLTSFQDKMENEFKINDDLTELFKEYNQKEPTPIQKHTIPIYCSSQRDIMACAQTGSGKTAAQAMPVINKLLNDGPGYDLSTDYLQSPYVLVLSPTRELAIQIYETFLLLTKNLGIRVSVIQGGADSKQQRRRIVGHCDILVATCGRLKDFYQKKVISFKNIKHLIVDECDRLLDMGFEPELNELVLKSDMTSVRQTLMCSATLKPEVIKIAEKFLSNPVLIVVGQLGKTPSEIDQELKQVSNDDKLNELQYKFEEQKDNKILVFVETKKKCKQLEQYIKDERKARVACIHGDKAQPEREKALNDFKQGRVKVLIATDVAARGLDLPDIKLVINMDMPRTLEDYIHRIGRTGRIGQNGKAISFINEENKGIIKSLYDYMQENVGSVPKFMEVAYKECCSYRGNKRYRN